jgi:hypothetical protein
MHRSVAVSCATAAVAHVVSNDTTAESVMILCIVGAQADRRAPAGATAAIIQRLVAAIDANLIQPLVGSDPQPFTGRMAARPGYDPLVPRVWTIDVMID